MGKANRKLDDNDDIHRQKNLATFNHELDVHDDGIVISNQYNKADEKVHKIALMIQQQLVEYTTSEAYPICEFLDIVNVENYVKWILSLEVE